MEKTISIKDLKNNNNINHVEVDISELKGKREKENANKDFMDKTFDVVDAAMNRIAKESIEYIEKVEEEILQEEIEKEIENDDEEDLEMDAVQEEEQSKDISIFELDEEDFEDEEDDIETKTDSEKQITDIKNKLKEKIKPVAKVIDLSTFTISNKPVSISSALKATGITRKHIADWVFPAEGRSISVEEFTGLEIEKLNINNSSRNRINAYKDIYELIFRHIVDSKKPATMEQWVKKLNFFDLDHLYFAIYKSSFEGSNFIPYSCPHCNETFVSENVKMDDMIKYKDEETKARMIELLNSDSTSESDAYNVELVQVNDSYVVGLREPSVYNMIFENVVLDEKFTEKYSELLSIITFVDSIYYIDVDNNELRPIEPKQYPENMVKNIKSKISTYSKILKTLNSDQFYQFNAYIKAIQEKHDEITYVLPKTTCTKCQKEIAESEMSAESLLFTRHQLTGIANS